MGHPIPERLPRTNRQVVSFFNEKAENPLFSLLFLMKMPK